MSPNRTPYVYKTVGDVAIHADVTLAPRGTGAAILWLHGGMLMAGGRADLPAAQLQRYVDAGYTVVSADYRLAPETKLESILGDVQSVYDWMRDFGAREFAIDPHRIAVMGHSAGGYLTLTAGFRLHPRPKALVSWYGYSDVDGDWYGRPDPFYCQQPAVSREDAYAVLSDHELGEQPAVHARGRFYLYCRQQGLWPNEVAGYDPRLQAEAFDAFCAIRNVTADYPPTLLIHGALDTDVPHAQSAQMARELERKGVPFEFISLPKHGHAFDLPPGAMSDPVVVDTFDRTVAFLDRYLGQPAAPAAARQA